MFFYMANSNGLAMPESHNHIELAEMILVKWLGPIVQIMTSFDFQVWFKSHFDHIQLIGLILYAFKYCGPGITGFLTFCQIVQIVICNA